MDNLQIFSIYSPVIAQPINPETEEQFIARWNKFDALPEIIKDKLSDSKTSDLIKNTGKVFNLDLPQISCISRAIRSYYFGELKLEDFAFILSKEINIDLAKANQIFQVIKERIINDQSYERAAQAALISIPLSEALKIYPEVGEQLVTSSKINLRNFPYPVRPSIKNWIADYTFVLGYEKHESMARSQYLFQGPNTKNLPAPEKNKLAFLLKSFDENSPLTVNKTTKQIIFPTHNATRSEAGRPTTNENRLPENLSAQFRPAFAPKEEQKNINSMQFSYRQKLPYEKNLPSEIPAGSRSAERISRGEPQNFPIKPTTPSRNFPTRIPPAQNLSKNVVDLKNIQG